MLGALVSGDYSQIYRPLQSLSYNISLPQLIRLQARVKETVRGGEVLSFKEVQSILGNVIEVETQSLIKEQLARFAAIGSVIKLYEKGYKAANMKSKFTTELKEFMISTFKHANLDRICALHKRLTERMSFWKQDPTLLSEGYPLDCYIFSNDCWRHDDDFDYFDEFDEFDFDTGIIAQFNEQVDSDTVIKTFYEDNLDLLIEKIREEIDNGSTFQGDLGIPFRVQPDPEDGHEEGNSGNQGITFSLLNISLISAALIVVFGAVAAFLVLRFKKRPVDEEDLEK
jgi:hypothetical protein